MRIGIVNDMQTSLLTLRCIIEDLPGSEVLWEAENGAEAVKYCSQQLPDIILMDLIMPVMNGVQATREIMQKTACAILIVTSDVDQNMPMVYEAIGEGAMDAVNMPGLDKTAIAKLVTKIKSLEKIISDDKRSHKHSSPTVCAPGKKSHETLIAIGASTGGPAAIKIILDMLPKNLDAAVVVIQHLDRDHASGFADWLSESTAMNVCVACSGDVPKKGTVLIAKTNDNMILTESSGLMYTKDPVEEVYRPSVNEFFASAALYWKGPVIGVLLTGMGRDGGRGLLALRRLGHMTVAQEPESCAVYGMPRDAAERYAAVKYLKPHEIGALLAKEVTSNQIRETGS